MKRWVISCDYVPLDIVVNRCFTVEALNEEDAKVLAKYRLLEAGKEFEFRSIREDRLGILNFSRLSLPPERSKRIAT